MLSKKKACRNHVPPVTSSLLLSPRRIAGIEEVTGGPRRGRYTLPPPGSSAHILIDPYNFTRKYPPSAGQAQKTLLNNAPPVISSCFMERIADLRGGNHRRAQARSREAPPARVLRSFRIPHVRQRPSRGVAERSRLHKPRWGAKPPWSPLGQSATRVQGPLAAPSPFWAFLKTRK